MCFTLTGRLYTRLFTLIGPCLLASVLSWWSNTPDYWLLPALMLVVGLGLDLAVYDWLIGYQSRWLTLALAALEFALLKWAMEAPYPLEVRLRTRQALVFYLVSWGLIWLTLHVALPRFWPRWSEDGGVVRTIASAMRAGGATRSRLERRMSWGIALLVVSVGWLAHRSVAALAPDGTLYTGLLAGSAARLGELAAATRAAKGGAEPGLAGLIGGVAQLGRWPVLLVYQCAWLISGWLLILGAHHVARLPWLYLPLVGLFALWSPVMLLALAAALVWALAWVPALPISWPRPGRQMRGMLLASVAVALVASLALSRPTCYLDRGDWQALVWMRQRFAPETVVVAPVRLRPLVEAFSGVRTSDSTTGAVALVDGAACLRQDVLFRHADVCVVALP